MPFELSILGGSTLSLHQTADELLCCNSRTQLFGLTITPEQAVSLAQARGAALKDTGRIELGSGALTKLIKAFCNSPYITQQNLEQVFSELLETFFYFKNETNDKISDDKLIEYMKACFDGPCQGSVELLFGRELPKLLERHYDFREPYESEDSDDLD